MLELSAKYNEVFKPSSPAMEQTYLEGVENCVCKNLYGVLFGDDGIGSVPQKATDAGDNPNIPASFNVCQAHAEESEHNSKIRDNITRFGNFVEPRHLEIDESRLISDRVEQACV